MAQNDLNRVVIEYYQNMFTASKHLQDIDEVTLVIRSRVCGEDNAMLTMQGSFELQSLKCTRIRLRAGRRV